MKVISVQRESPAWKAGIRRGDRIVRVAGRAARDDLDMGFYAARHRVTVDFLRRGKMRTVRLLRNENEFLGIEVSPPPLRRCVNRCVFCFVDQLPSGMRKSLYVKDDDVRHSFLHGNYVTLSTVRRQELERIVRRSLSPLYVSVHATDREVRNAMLRNPRAPDVLEQLRLLAAGRVQLHAQIVVCPGYNDGAVLRRTIKDLFSIGKEVLSVAVVPVGVTRYRKFPLRTVDGPMAREICRLVSVVGDEDARRMGRRRLFAADELYIIAGMPIPPRSYYGDYPQQENGVGLVRQLLDQWRSLKRYASNFWPVRRNVVVVTSVSAAPYLSTLVNEMAAGRSVELLAVPNRFFGETVNVAGLLTGRDVVDSLLRHESGYERVVLPAVMFNERGVTLDGWSLKRISSSVGVPVLTASTAGELAVALQVCDGGILEKGRREGNE